MSALDLDSALPLKETDEAEASRLRHELQLLKSEVEQEDDSKSRLIVKKLEMEQEKKKSNKLMKDLIQKQDSVQRLALDKSTSLQQQVTELRRRKMELTEKLKRSRAQLHQQRAETQRLQTRFKICAELLDSEVEFVKPKPDADDDITDEQPIRGQFSVCQEGALQLTGGQALITFEEERVVSQILQSGRCSVSFDDHTLEVTPKRIRTEPLVQFQVLLSVSRSQLAVSDVMSSMPKDRVEDRLELSFCRPSRGGAEVRSVNFNPQLGSAQVHFLRPGAAEWLALRGEHAVDLDFQSVVKVAPVYEHQLHKFQSFCGAPKRTLLLDNVRDTGDEEEVQDQLEIHFQKPSNGGGEIEHTLYTSRRLQAVLSPDL